MTANSASVEIAKSPAQTFAYIDDVDREQEWQPNLRSAQQDPQGPTAVGSRKSYVSLFLGREVKNTYVVLEYEPGRRVVCETEKGSAIDARSEIVCEASALGTTVTMLIAAKPRGVLKFLPRSVLESAYREELTTTLQRLKDRLESMDQPGGSV